MIKVYASAISGFYQGPDSRPPRMHPLIGQLLKEVPRVCPGHTLWALSLDLPMVLTLLTVDP